VPWRLSCRFAFLNFSTGVPNAEKLPKLDRSSCDDLASKREATNAQILFWPVRVGTCSGARFRASWLGPIGAHSNSSGPGGPPILGHRCDNRPLSTVPALPSALLVAPRATALPQILSSMLIQGVSAARHRTSQRQLLTDVAPGARTRARRRSATPIAVRKNPIGGLRWWFICPLVRRDGGPPRRWRSSIFRPAPGISGAARVTG
jgi:hypothetical protein